MPTSTPANSPFDLPELRHQISRFVAVQDAISCAQVSKALFSAFIPVVWFEINFAVHPRFANLPPDIISKHGHLIRIVKNADSSPQVSALANVGVNKLRELAIELSVEAALQDVPAYEIVGRNNTCLKKLCVSASSASTETHDPLTIPYVFTPALVPFSGGGSQSGGAISNLVTLQISGMRLTHDELVVILQGSPQLCEVAMMDVDIVGVPTHSFQHVGVRALCATIEDIFHVEPVAANINNPSLLSYFPKLSFLGVGHFETSEHVIPKARIKEDLTRYCPQLSGFLAYDSPGVVTYFCSHIVKELVDVVFDTEQATAEDSITALLAHRASLRAVTIISCTEDFDFEEDDVAPVSKDFQGSASSQILQLIPRSCLRLDELDLHAYEMDMGDIEKSEWVCTNLTTLAIRIKGLDTKEKITKAIALWRKGCWRRWKKKAGALIPIGEQDPDPTDDSIEARVARHLLKFDKLWWIWLGYQTWTPI